jgi:serine protease Do
VTIYRRGFPAILAVVVGFSLGVSAAMARGAPESFADLAAKLLPSVVNISTTQIQKKTNEKDGPQIPRFPEGSPFQDFFKEFFDRQQRETPQRRATSLGSGFIIASSGFVVTNNHVIAEADEITVTLHDDTKLEAKLIGRDAKTDLALLKVEPKKPLTAVSFGDSRKSRVGDWVVAIGNPFGLGGTVTAGIVSARQRDINSGPYDDFIQTDASINRGNSGGPMFNLAGEVIGINTAIYSPSGGSVGIGFAIPSNLARPIIEQLQKFGKARRGWLGVRIQSVSEEIAQSLGMKNATGALVASITKGGPAEKYKIKVGDVILKFDNKVPERKQEETSVVAIGEIGMTLSVLTAGLREKFKLDDDARGVVITEVVPSGPAAEKRIPVGAIIRKIGPYQEVVTSPAQVQQKINQAKKAKLNTILVLIESGGTQRFVALNIKNG